MKVDIILRAKNGAEQIFPAIVNPHKCGMTFRLLNNTETIIEAVEVEFKPEVEKC